MKNIIINFLLVLLFAQCIFCDTFFISRSGGVNEEYKSMEIDVNTGFYFDQSNHKGKVSEDDIRTIDNLIDSDAFKNIEPKYINQLENNQIYRYAFTSKKIGVIFDLNANYPKILDPVVLIFEKYSN
ncbi:hypothetical protein CYY_002428 [Polysphondylium violaceum]|uniref:Lipoprotein n=1 Tax=Polysphondylium violaceum TaxID=133409 RepID=A0A8J4PZD0_9MYCE|nr:hypothetical protein CYY_002428 [Polysphondylium violaceum]